MMNLINVILLNLALQSWTDLESKLPTTPSPPVYYESLPEEFHNTNKRPIFFRDRESICPESEMVWLALELKEADYITVLTTTDYSKETTPRIHWSDGTIQTDPYEIIERIEKEYSDRSPDLYKRISKAVDNVRCNIVRFKGVFPRKSLPSIHAPFIFHEDGGLMSQSNHMVSLEEVDEVLEEYDDGPFLCGDFISAADIVWAPYLERYAAQLPLTYGGEELTPRSSAYETLKGWYEAMEELVPCYSCRVAGDQTSWQNVLIKAVENDNVPSIDILPVRGKRVPTDRKNFDAQKIWGKYIENKPWLASTPQEECVAFMVRNRDEIIDNATQDTKLSTSDRNEIDDALREIVNFLLNSNDNAEQTMSENARDVVGFLNQFVQAPRDMGMLPVASLRLLALSVEKQVV